MPKKRKNKKRNNGNNKDEKKKKKLIRSGMMADIRRDISEAFGRIEIAMAAKEEQLQNRANFLDFVKPLDNPVNIVTSLGPADDDKKSGDFDVSLSSSIGAARESIDATLKSFQDRIRLKEAEFDRKEKSLINPVEHSLESLGYGQRSAGIQVSKAYLDLFLRRSDPKTLKRLLRSWLWTCPNSNVAASLMHELVTSSSMPSKDLEFMPFYEIVASQTGFPADVCKLVHDYKQGHICKFQRDWDKNGVFHFISKSLEKDETFHQVVTVTGECTNQGNFKPKEFAGPTKDSRGFCNHQPNPGKNITVSLNGFIVSELTRYSVFASSAAGCCGSNNWAFEALPLEGDESEDSDWETLHENKMSTLNNGQTRTIKLEEDDPIRAFQQYKAVRLRQVGHDASTGCFCFHIGRMEIYGTVMRCHI